MIEDEIDQLLRKKLGLDEKLPFDQIEQALLSPLLKTALSGEVPEHKGPVIVEHKIQAPKEIDGELKFGTTWIDFMNLSKQEFERAIKDNLSAQSLSFKKSLILCRVRKQIEAAKMRARGQLDARDVAPPTAGSRNSSLTPSKPLSIDKELFTTIVSATAEALTLVKNASLAEPTRLGKVSYDNEPGERELFLEKVQFFLAEYDAFFTGVETEIQRSHTRHSFFDMLPSTFLRSTNIVDQCHIGMHAYIIKNLNKYSAHLASTKIKKEHPSWIDTTWVKTVPSWFNTAWETASLVWKYYNPHLSMKKRENVRAFIIALSREPDTTVNKSVTLDSYISSILTIIDTHHGSAVALRGSYNPGQTLEAEYQRLHEKISAMASDTVRTEHTAKCVRMR